MPNVFLADNALAVISKRISSNILIQGQPAPENLLQLLASNFDSAPHLRSHHWHWIGTTSHRPRNSHSKNSKRFRRNVDTGKLEYYGYPQINIFGKTYSVVTTLFEALYDRKFSRITCQCGVLDCVNPYHHQYHNTPRPRNSVRYFKTRNGLKTLWDSEIHYLKIHDPEVIGLKAGQTGNPNRVPVNRFMDAEERREHEEKQKQIAEAKEYAEQMATTDQSVDWVESDINWAKETLDSKIRSRLLPGADLEESIQDAIREFEEETLEALPLPLREKFERLFRTLFQSHQ